MNNAQTITINKQRFVAGLYWQTLTRPRDHLREAKEIGKREKMDVVAIRRGRVLQAGFATRNTAGSGAYSLAATLAGVLGDDWIAVFQLGEFRYAIAAAKNGAIIPGCDEIGSREQIEESLRTSYNLHQFAKVICPAHFDFGGEEVDLTRLLSSHKLVKAYKLHPLSTTSNLKPLLLVGIPLLLIVGGGSIGYVVYRDYVDEKEAAAAAAAAEVERQRLEALKVSSGKHITPAALEHPWVAQPLARDFREACVEAIHGFPISIGGWMIESALCTNGLVQGTYRRTPNTTVNGFTTQAMLTGRRVDMVDAAGETGTVSVPLPELRAGGDDSLFEMDQVTSAVRSLMQRREATYSMAVKNIVPPTPQALPGEPAPEPPPVPDWKTHTLMLSGKRTPELLLSGMENLPGLRLDSISVQRSQSELEWKLTGELNGK